jgi:protein-L-isoaspartate(D-aspartate) O-methyltransferase
MLDDIREEVRITRHMIRRHALADEVMGAMAEVPRHQFVPAALRGRAYDNGPLPIGHGQTISQPYIVALMIDMIAPRPEHRVLEIGAGCGYQAAVLSRLVKQVYSLEIVESLGLDARDRLQRMGYDNVEIGIGNGFRGWPEHAPYDGIIVAAAPERVPPALVEQLRPGGRMAVPVGGQWHGQDLVQVVKDEEGEVSVQSILPVAFVPMIGDGPY